MSWPCMSANATFSGTVLLCPFGLEQPHDIADSMYVQVSAAPLAVCLAVYAEVPERAMRVCVDGVPVAPSVMTCICTCSGL